MLGIAAVTLAAAGCSTAPQTTTGTAPQTTTHPTVGSTPAVQADQRRITQRSAWPHPGPDGNLIAVNGNNGDAIEVTPTGRQLATVTLVPHGAGDLFGVTPLADGQGLLFVNDGTNALDLSAPEATIAPY